MNLKKAISFFKSLSGSAENGTPERPDTAELVMEIKQAVEEKGTVTGKRIHRTDYLNMDLRLDIDITRSYRISVMRGNEKIYSFSVLCDLGDYEALHNAYDEVISYLESERSLRGLPDNDLLKGYYFGG